jgi:hypothetical protein
MYRVWDHNASLCLGKCRLVLIEFWREPMTLTLVLSQALSLSAFQTNENSHPASLSDNLKRLIKTLSPNIVLKTIIYNLACA